MSSKALYFTDWHIFFPAMKRKNFYRPRTMALQTALLLLPLDQLPSFKASAQVQACLGREGGGES